MTDNGTGNGAALIDSLKEKKESTKRRPSERDQLINLATTRVDLWHNQTKEACATVPDGRSFHVEKGMFREWLLEAYYRITGRGVSGNAAQQAIDTIAAVAKFDQPMFPSFFRAARVDDEIFVNLENVDNQCVRVTAEGWDVIELTDSTTKFIATDRALGLPIPTQGKSLDALWKMMNIPTEMRPRVIMWLLTSLGATAPYPILAIEGPQGSSKSTTARTLRRLVDPNSVDLRSPPKTEEDLAACANNSHVLAFDNISYLSPHMADAFCRVATGAGLGARRYYTQGDEHLIEMQRPIIINGITSLLTRPDLASRSLMIRLPAIREHLTEEDYWRRFNELQAGVFGALLEALSYGLAHPISSSISLPRMADSARWSISCAPALGLDQDEFADAVNINAADVLRASVEGDSFIEALRGLIDRDGKWSGPAGQLLVALARFKTLEDKPKPKDWPDSPRGVTAKLERTANALAAYGLRVTKSETVRDGYRTWTIEPAQRDGSQEPPW